MSSAPELEIITAVPRLRPRAADSHKGDFGRVLVIAGSRGMAGAAGLVGASALRSGAGLVRVACPVEVQPTVAGLEPSYMTWPLAQDEQGRIDFARARSELERWIAASDVVAAGPGLGRSPGLDQLVGWLVEHVAVPLVLDADALNALVGETDRLRSRTQATIVTPHPGEFARLTGRPATEIQADRPAHAAALARASAGTLIVVLKGQGTVVTDGLRLYVNGSGNPGMATGGSGDCLTGVIAALLGQRLAPFDAAVLGVYAHGLAGDIARDQSGMVGLIAGDIVDSLPDAFYHLGVDE
jgi:NAD(P)H-hydrate epimerase